MFGSEDSGSGVRLASNSSRPRRLCELLDACGGNLVGEWTTEDVCVSFLSTGTPPVPNCEGSTIGGIIGDVEGSYVFDADGNYTANMKYAGLIVVTAPKSCLRPGASCTDLMADGDDLGCIASGDSCECQRKWKLESAGDVRGTYTTMGSMIEYSNDGPMEYCAKEDSLTLRTIAEVPHIGATGLSVEVQVELTRR